MQNIMCQCECGGILHVCDKTLVLPKHMVVSENPFQYQECLLDHSLGVGKDSVSGNAPTVPDSAIWASSHTTDRRLPHMARLEDPTGEL
ncbi:hypothetical protein DPMN_074205 [Dreissena polymorpha]|uniref:Uncharacterized protein n=1 Tax=Dreissena polymorpha TaxID=45954 RepID=A0A9D3YI62_DREPO|nr:hypothetical protein DPMN_074205 [Dreissena polymorpha]